MCGGSPESPAFFQYTCQPDSSLKYRPAFAGATVLMFWLGTTSCTCRCATSAEFDSANVRGTAAISTKINRKRRMRREDQAPNDWTQCTGRKLQQEPEKIDAHRPESREARQDESSARSQGTAHRQFRTATEPIDPA